MPSFCPSLAAAPLPPPGTVRVLLGDGLRIVELLAGKDCPPHIAPAAIIVDVNAGGGELRTGLSFPPKAFLSKVFLTQLRGALAHSKGLLALNLGARGALKGAALGAIARAFSAEGPIAVVAGEEAEEEGGGDLNCVVLAGTPLQRLRGGGGGEYKPTLNWVEA